MDARQRSLKDDLESIQVNLALRGQLNGYLPPHLWETARQRLQSQYRRATGESMAVLNVETWSEA